MPVPEAAMHKDRESVFWKHHIRLSRQTLDVEAESEAAGMQIPTDFPLRSSVLAPNARHHPRACFFIYNIHEPMMADVLEHYQQLQGEYANEIRYTGNQPVCGPGRSQSGIRVNTGLLACRIIG